MDLNLKDKTYEAMLTSSNVGKSVFNEKGTTTLTASLLLLMHIHILCIIILLLTIFLIFSS